MKILPVEKVREADAYTIANEPIASIDLMERAAGLCTGWILKHLSDIDVVFVFCGTGNNGGDGLVIARQLAGFGVLCKVFVVKAFSSESVDFAENYQRLAQEAQVEIIEIDTILNFPLIPEKCLMVDAIFGSGLSKPVSGLAAEVIQMMNKSGALLIAIDMPSGLFADQSVQGMKSEIVKADYTLTFGPPKLCFLLPENEQYTGRWVLLDIGLHPDYIQNVQVLNYYTEASDIIPMIRKRGHFSHKGTFGHALIIAGSYGKAGAAILSAKACLRTGAGLVTVHVPDRCVDVVQTASPETMVSMDENQFYIGKLPETGTYQAIGIGPGIGKNEITARVVKLLIQNSLIPLVLDADALNILGENKTWLAFLPKGSILTPHPKEFERIAGKTSNHFERLQLQREFSIKFGVYVVLKGAFTSVTTPDGRAFFNSTGNPGMATAGSGDVLTGIITGLLAQQYTPLESAILGVYLHGLAGDIAGAENGFEALIAGDIINSIGKAYLQLTDF